MEGERRGVGGTLLNIARREGLSALYSGLVPGLQRQMAFSAIRIGLYDTVKVRYMEVLGVREDDMMEIMNNPSNVDDLVHTLVTLRQMMVGKKSIMVTMVRLHFLFN